MFIKIIIAIVLLVFICVEINIICFSSRDYNSNVDYVVLLGSGVTDKGPSLDFVRRIDSAYEYLTSNNSKVIVTGGKGRNEPVSEAFCAKQYLIEKGIVEDRIVVEDNSFSTYENLFNAKRLIENEKGDLNKNSVLVVSSCFHLYRASYLCNKLGYTNVSFKPSLGVVYLWPYSYTREFFALVKEIIFFTLSK